MNKPAKPHKTEVVHVRLDPKMKKAAKKRAAEQARSLANYIEALIMKDLGEQ